LLAAATARAGEQHADCANASGTITMGAGNSDAVVTVKLPGKAAPYTAPVAIRRTFEDAGTPDEGAVIAVPISDEKVVASKHQHMHVKHADGTTCDGRERWDDRIVQRFVLMAQGAQPLTAVLAGKPPELTRDGFLVVDMRCHVWGVTSPDGCIAQDGDAHAWVDER
jgi:hypothetical protein